MKDLDQTIVTGNKTIRFQPSEMRPHLVVLYPQSQFKQIALSVGSVILGRGSDADVHLDDELVSRKHCKISFDGLHITVEDLGSTNGTYVDGNAITKAILGPAAPSWTGASVNSRSQGATTITFTASWWTSTTSNA